MSSRTVVVYGDVMLDEFVWGDVTRISPEAPVPVVDIRRESVHLGGAANVWRICLALGARANVVGVIGRDHAGERLRAELRRASRRAARQLLVVDESRLRQRLKTRIIAHSQFVVRADRERRTPVEAASKNNSSRPSAALSEADAFVVSDYDKGAVTPRVLGEILPLAYERGIPVLVDPKIRNFPFYRPATLITPNHHEALRLTNTEDQTDEGLKEAAI